MTDQPGADDPTDRPDDTAAPDPKVTAFDAALQGESWESSRRRRTSSSGSTGSGSGRSARGSRRGSSGPRSSSGHGRRSSANRRARHIRSLVLHVVLGLLGVGLAWIVVTGLLAAYQLHEAQSDLATLRTQITSGGDRLEATAQSLTDHAHRAEVLTRGPAWALAAAVPYVGEPVEAVRGITRETSTLVDGAAPGLVAVADDVNPRTVVRGGTVDIAAVTRAGPAVRDVSEVVSTAAAGAADLPRSTWLPPVDTATNQLVDQLGDLAGTLRATDQAMQVLPSMLGGDGRTRRYFVAFQNNAELRGTGGIPGAFAILAATDGKVAIERFESDTVLGGVVPTGLDFGAAFNKHYASNLVYSQYVNSNLSPHFPYAAQIWCAMWKQATGEQLDGALTVDPGALSYLLKATGPAVAPDGEKVTADNVVALLQKDAYAKFPQLEESADRKDYILGIAEAAEKKILAGTGNSRALLQGFARGVSERRIVAWSADPTAQAVLASTTIGGTVADTDQPYSLLYVNNGGGGKLDYYLERGVRVERTGCGAMRDVTVTVTLKNTAPASGLPPYVTVRTDNPTFPTETGQVRSIVDYVATRGTFLAGTTIDGQPATTSIYDEQGHQSFENAFEIKPGQTVTWVLKLQEPAGTQPYTVAKQPGVTTTEVTVDDRSCR